MGTPCGASAIRTSEFGSSDVATMSSMLNGFGSAEERMKKACTKTHYGYRFCSRLIWKVGLFFGLSYLRDGVFCI
nr:hypothetical protein CFP56_61881 [Quercus suber]